MAWLAARLWALREVRTAVPDFEAKHGSIDPARWSHPPDEPGVRAGRLLRAAALVFDRSEPHFSRWRRESREARDRGPDARVSEEILESVVDRNALALELVREAAREPACLLYEALPSPFGGEIVDFFALWEIDRIEQQLALAALARGDAAATERHLATTLALSQCLRTTPPQVPASVGLAIERSNLHLLRSLVESGRIAPLSGDVVTRLELSASFEGFWSSLAAEAAMFQPPLDRRRSRGLPGPEPPPHPWNPWSVAGFPEAATLRAISRGIDALDEPGPPRPEKISSFAPWRLDDHYFAAFADDWWLRARRLEAHAAARELALLATRLGSASRQGATEDELARISHQHAANRTALVDERIEVKREPDGEWVLSLPATAARWEELAKGQPSRLDLPWTWRVPPSDPTPD